jgi:hypothetical protein
MNSCVVLIPASRVLNDIPRHTRWFTDICDGLWSDGFRMKFSMK